MRENDNEAADHHRLLKCRSFTVSVTCTLKTCWIRLWHTPNKLPVVFQAKLVKYFCVPTHTRLTLIQGYNEHWQLHVFESAQEVIRNAQVQWSTKGPISTILNCWTCICLHIFPIQKMWSCCWGGLSIESYIDPWLQSCCRKAWRCLRNDG